MSVDDWLLKEAAALTDRYMAGDYTLEEYKAEMSVLKRDAKQEQDRQDIIDAGRGHLLK